MLHLSAGVPAGEPWSTSQAPLGTDPAEMQLQAQGGGRVCGPSPQEECVPWSLCSNEAGVFSIQTYGTCFVKSPEKHRKAQEFPILMVIRGPVSITPVVLCARVFIHACKDPELGNTA